VTNSQLLFETIPPFRLLAIGTSSTPMATTVVGLVLALRKSGMYFSVFKEPATRLSC